MPPSWNLVKLDLKIRNSVRNKHTSSFQKYRPVYFCCKSNIFTFVCEYLKVIVTIIFVT
jgi:hypothetical protein